MYWYSAFIVIVDLCMVYFVLALSITGVGFSYFRPEKLEARRVYKANDEANLHNRWCTCHFISCPPCQSQSTWKLEPLHACLLHDFAPCCYQLPEGQDMGHTCSVLELFYSERRSRNSALHIMHCSWMHCSDDFPVESS